MSRRGAALASPHRVAGSLVEFLGRTGRPQTWDRGVPSDTGSPSPASRATRVTPWTSCYSCDPLDVVGRPYAHRVVLIDNRERRRGCRLGGAVCLAPHSQTRPRVTLGQAGCYLTTGAGDRQAPPQLSSR